MNYPSELLQTYEVYNQIGAGGGGTVYRGFHKRLKKDVVIKRLKGTAATSLQDCHTEVDILKNLRHSYLPQVHDFFDSPEGIFTIMDFIPGQSLQDMLDHGHKFTEKEVLKYTRQLCEALNYLHSQNPPIVHGDIKPDNIMITLEGNVCLIDFNISGMLEGKGAVTFGYTQGFSAPEQVEAFHKLKKQMQRNAGKNQKSAISTEEKQVKSPVQQSDSADKTVLLQEYDDKTVLLSEDVDKTVLLSDDNSDKTLLLSDSEEKTVLLEAGQAWKEVAAASEELQKKQATTCPNRGMEGIRIDKRSDVFSLGATIYTLLTGKLYDTQDRKAEYPDISDGFCIVLEKALENTPNRRYQDAGRMLQAITDVHKKDKRYKRLIRHQIFFVFLMLVCAGVSTVVSYRGYQMMSRENAEVMYTKAMTLYEQREYEEGLSFLLKEALTDESIYNRGELGNLYYLAAECFFEIEEYEAAVSYYKKAVIYNTNSAEYYCNYAISLARLGKEQEASQVIDTAAEKGITTDMMYLMKGELFVAQEKFQQAVECLEQCIYATKDSYILARAYMVYSDIFAHIENYTKNEEALLQNVAVLIRATEELDTSYQPFALERLVEAQGALYDLTSDIQYAENAIGYAGQMKQLGWDTFDVCVNLGMLYESTGQYKESYSAYQECLEKYGENYVVYKKMAFLELAVQEGNAPEERSYEQFAEHYSKAMKLYENTGKQKDQDTELALLEDNYNALLNGGWIK